MIHSPALELVRYSALAYKDLATVKAACPGSTVALLEGGNTQAYVIETLENTVVSFRGTQVTENFSMGDVIQNTKIRPVDWQPGIKSNAGRVHRGYKEGVEAIWDDLAQVMRDTRPPHTYTGHSMGGVESTYARCLEPHPDFTITFGAPKIGDHDFVITTARHHLIRYVHARDIAPKHPIVLLGYRHGGKLRKISRDGKIVERSWRLRDEIIWPFGITIGTLDHRIDEYQDKLRGVER